MCNEAILIDLKEFAKRISVEIARAREMSRSRVFFEKGIAVNINPDGKRGGTRIHWEKYLEFISKNPVVPEDKRVRSKLKVI